VAKQTDVDDESLGGLKSEFRGFDTVTGDNLIKKAPALKRRGRGPKVFQEKFRGRSQNLDTITYADELDTALDDTAKYYKFFSDDANVMNAMKSVVTSGGGNRETKIARLRELGLDDAKASQLLNSYDAINANYVPMNVMGDKGTTRPVDMRPAPKASYKLNYTATDGQEYSLDELVAHKAKDGIEPGFIAKHEELIKNTFRKYGHHISTDTAMKQVEGEVARAKKGKAFVSDNQATKALDVFRLANNNSPSLVKAQDEDSRLKTRAYSDAAGALNKQEGFIGGEFNPRSYDSTDPTDNNDEQHNKIVDTMGKQLEKKGVKFTLDLSKPRHTIDIVDNEVALATRKTKDMTRPTMLKNKGRIQELGNNLKVTATLPNGQPIQTSSIITESEGGDGLQLSFAGSDTTYSIPFTASPDDINGLVERHFTEEIIRKYGSAPSNIYSDNIVKTLNTRSRR
jgi:hypothetical protein